ncbi:PIN-like domain-containing protein [Pantoea ananatis]|uniref:PIN-like domain-containing protein n=1 Tax=Pantoea ananas TaxID=553 RepID=UPI002024B5D3|nr:PIN-like domain-containing protein [Pantoea ananatis]URL13301.1 PIN-like domain-containing protein [Pantoea ananatis]
MIETLLKIHKDSEEIDFKEIWKKGTFVFDANVLLDLYRLPESATKDLISVLNNKDFNKKIWIGFQGLIEFLSNRHETISDQKNKFTTVKNLINQSIAQYDLVFENLKNELSKLQLKQRHSLIDPDKFLTPENIENGKNFLESFIEDLLNLENKQSDVNDEDKIKTSILEMFKGKIGAGFTKQELDDIYEEGEVRYKNSIPPGYKDVKKPGAYIVEDREFSRKFGDLVLWKELIKMAIESKAPYIILVTGDVKEDWWIEKRGKKLGPRKELLNEIYLNAPELKTFYMYDTSSFLRHAKKELSIDISDTSIKQAKDLIERSRKNKPQDEIDIFFIHELIENCALNHHDINVTIGHSVMSLPLIGIEQYAFYKAFFEIYCNATLHGLDKHIDIEAKKTDNHILLSFKNKCNVDLSSSELNNIKAHSQNELSERGSGIIMIKNLMQVYGIETIITQEKRSFMIELKIPKTFFI